MTKELAWKIIKGELSLSEKLALIYPDKAKEIIEEIKEADKEFCFAYFEISNTIAYYAYCYLVDVGEIDKDKLFNMNQRIPSKEWPLEHYNGDLGYKNKELYRYTGNEWINVSESLKA